MKLDLANYYDEALYKKCFYFLEYDPQLSLFINYRGEPSLLCYTDRQSSYFNTLFSRALFRNLFANLGYAKPVVAVNKVDNIAFSFQNIRFGFDSIYSNVETDILDFRDKIIRPVDYSTVLGRKVDSESTSSQASPAIITYLLQHGYKLSDDFFENLPMSIPDLE